MSDRALGEDEEAAAASIGFGIEPFSCCDAIGDFAILIGETAFEADFIFNALAVFGTSKKLPGCSELLL